MHRRDLILNIAVAIGFFVLGIIASPPFEDYWDANIVIVVIGGHESSLIYRVIIQR